QSERLLEALPLAPFGLELFEAARRELVEARAAVVLRRAPASFDQPLALEAAERRIQRAVVHVEHALGYDLNGLREIPAVRRPRAQQTKDDQVERALQQVGLARAHGSTFL